VSTIGEGSLAEEPEDTRSEPLLGKGMGLLFVALFAIAAGCSILETSATRTSSRSDRSGPRRAD